MHVLSMVNKLIPPFMMREAGITVNDVPKIQTEDPTESDHVIIFNKTGFWILLSLWGTFSYFPTAKPTKLMLVDPEDVYLITPTHWNPNSNAYMFNEESMLDWEGNMQPKCDREQCLVFDDISNDEAMVASLHIGAIEQAQVDIQFDGIEFPGDELDYLLLDSQFKINIGSTNVGFGKYLDDDDTASTDSSTVDDQSS